MAVRLRAAELTVAKAQRAAPLTVPAVPVPARNAGFALAARKGYTGKGAARCAFDATVIRSSVARSRFVSRREWPASGDAAARRILPIAMSLSRMRHACRVVACNRPRLPQPNMQQPPLLRKFGELDAMLLEAGRLMRGDCRADRFDPQFKDAAARSFPTSA